VGADFPFGKFADASPQLLLFVGKREIHNILGDVSAVSAAYSQ
jgi:hypothetical protein